LSQKDSAQSTNQPAKTRRDTRVFSGKLQKVSLSGHTTLQKLKRQQGSLVILSLTFLSAAGFNSESEQEETIVSDPKTSSPSSSTSAGSMALLSSFLISPIPGLIRSSEAPARKKDFGASVPFERSSFFAFASPSVFEAFLDFQFSGNNVFLLSKKEGGEILGIIL
jgi:hypothetical protein